jgi:hypothetical protein
MSGYSTVLHGIIKLLIRGTTIMLKLTIRYSKKGERPQVKTVELSEDEPISIFDIKERFVPEGYALDYWAFSKLKLI